MLADERFKNVRTLAELSVKLVETNKFDRHALFTSFSNWC
jgi:hypothetical protein